MKVHCPTGKETFDDETLEEALPRRDHEIVAKPSFGLGRP
jgi:hypothetical protein